MVRDQIWRSEKGSGRRGRIRLRLVRRLRGGGSRRGRRCGLDGGREMRSACGMLVGFGGWCVMVG
jgi:hypothetical protein